QEARRGVPGLTRRRFVHLGGAAIAATWAGGCASPAPVRWSGVAVATGHQIVLVAGAMPAGATFTGTYRSPHSADLELAQDGGRLTGRYGDGGLTGAVSGSLATFAWIERGAGLQGTGYFLYDALTGRARLFGWRTFLAPERRDGGPWTAVRIS